MMHHSGMSCRGKAEVCSQRLQIRRKRMEPLHSSFRGGAYAPSPEAIATGFSWRYRDRDRPIQDFAPQSDEPSNRAATF